MCTVILALLALGVAGARCPQGVDARLEAERLLAAGRSTSDEALACAQQAADEPGESRGSARDLLGRVLEDRGEWKAARERYRAAVAARRTAQSGLAESLADLAAIELRLGERDAAARVLAELKRRAAPDDPVLARRLALEAQLMRDRGRYAQALALAQEALRRLERQGAQDGARVASLNQLGELEWFLGNFGRSREWHTQALELARSSLGASHPATAASLANLALVELMLSDVDAALVLEREALAITEAVRGSDHPETLDRLQDLANLDVEHGDYPAALAAYERVLELSERRFGAQSDQSAHVLHNLGLVELRLGRPARALGWLERCLVIWERVHGPRHPFVARALDQLASAASGLGRLEAAAAGFSRAAAVRARAGEAERLGQAWDLARLGDVRRRQGRLPEARRLASRAALLCAGPTTQAKALAPALTLLGDLERHLGRTSAAAARYAAALAILDHIYGTDHPRSASLRARLAATSAQAGDPQAALAAAEPAERMRCAHLRRTIRYLAEGQALDFARQEPEGRDVLISVALGAHAPAESAAAAFEALVSARALVLDEMAARHAFLGGQEPDAALASLRQRLALLLYRQWDRPQESRLAALQSTRRELEQREQRAAARGASRGEAAADPRPAQLAGALPQGSALLAYARYRDAAQAGGADARYAAFVLRAGDARPRAWNLGPAGAIEARVAAWRAQLADVAGARRDPVEAERRALATGRALAALLWDPLAAALADRQLVLVVPDGPLALLSFAALPGAAGAPLLDGPTVLHELSAERDVLRWETPGPPPASLVAVGGPDYDAWPQTSGSPRAEAVAGASGLRFAGCAAADSARFSFLPEAAAEGEELVTLWERTQDGKPAQLLLGSAATEASFKQAAPAAGLLHLATHGFFDDPGCAAETRAPGLRGALAENPLMAAGLALAGANRHTAEAGGDDGLLTAAEVAQLDLRQTRWVVLSACGTGLGRVQHGEGVLGLQRAFAVAGVDTVVMSLWPVDDRSTRLFMRALYGAHLERGTSAAESVRLAQLELRERLRRELGAAPPALWAAFVGAGDWH